MAPKENRQYSHIAFISYKSEDEKWAQWLQQKLEDYHLPTALRKANPELPERIRPIFRDTTDFSGGSVTEAIMKGLQSARNLIVICSPRAANSKWVCKEVYEFRKLSKTNKIIPFIIEGEPHSSDPSNECFTQSLLELTDDVEPLAFNVKKLGREMAFIKVVSTLLNVDFDTIWNRHQRRERRKRQFIISGLVGVALLLIGLVFALFIANNSIRNERDAMYVSQTKAVASQAKKQIANGEILNSIMALLEVMPTDLDHPNRPYVAEADAALRMALDSLHFDNRRLTHTFASGVTKSQFTHDGKQIVSVTCFSDTTTSIALHSADTYQLLRTFTVPAGVLMSHISTDDQLIALQTGDGGQLAIFSLADGQSVVNIDFESADASSWVQRFEDTNLELYLIDNQLVADFNLDETPEVISYNRETGLALVRYNQHYDERLGYDASTWAVFDTKQKAVLWTDNLQEGICSSVVSLSPSGQYLASLFNETETLHVRDLQSGQTTTIALPNGSLFIDFTITLSWSADSHQLFYQTEMAESYIISIDTYSITKSFLDNEAKYLSTNAAGDQTLCTSSDNGVVLYSNTPLWLRDDDATLIDTPELGSLLCTQASGQTIKMAYSTIEPDSCGLYPSLTMHYRYSPRREDELCYEISCPSLGWTYANRGYYLEPVQNLHNGMYLVVKEETDNYFERYYDTHYAILETKTGTKVLSLDNVYGDGLQLLKLQDPLIAVSSMTGKTRLYEFPSYPELIKQCQAAVNGMTLHDAARRMFFLENP